MKINHQNIFFHHTGIVTKDIESSKYFFVNLGYKASKTFEDASFLSSMPSR
jgi:catechol 2,3-dioxygenase-like lactoylglutathione lyase family enzyme